MLCEVNMNLITFAVSMMYAIVFTLLCLLLFARPGGELVAGEDEIDGLKRSMTEVNSF